MIARGAISSYWPAKKGGHGSPAGQAANLQDLTWSGPEIVSILSTYVKLVPGDLIYTRTPAGVGPLQRGDVVEGGIDGLGTVFNTIR